MACSSRVELFFHLDAFRIQKPLDYITEKRQNKFLKGQKYSRLRLLRPLDYSNNRFFGENDLERNKIKIVLGKLLKLSLLYPLFCSLH